MSTAAKQPIYVVIPALNESKSIGSVVQSVLSPSVKVIVVDDGSTDNTAEIAASTGATVLKHVKNLGAWRAMQTGIRYAYQEGVEVVVTMDADGQHLAENIKELLAAYQGGADVVVGSCTSRGTLGRHIAWRFFKYINGFDIDDITSGFRLYNRKALKALISRPATMLEFQCVGVLIMLRNMDLKIQEIQVSMKERKSGISRIFNSWKSVFYYLAYSGLLSMSKAYPTNKSKFANRVNEFNNFD